MKTKVLVTVMTYPTLSQKHLETVCTAGFKEDGTWIRIYPVPHRVLHLEKAMYQKWQWIEADVEKTPQDDRPESYHIKNIDTLRLLDKIDGGRPNWDLRTKWVLKNKNIYENMTEILELTKRNKMSIAVLKPTEFIDFVIEDVDVTDYNRRLIAYKKQYEADRLQLSLFENFNSVDASFEFAKKIPYRFKYVFKTKDGKVRRLMIEDWEIGMLFMNCYWSSEAITEEDKRKEAIQKVKDKYWGFVQKENVYLFVGTQYKWQNLNAPNPYVIIGVYHVPRNRQLTLDF